MSVTPIFWKRASGSTVSSVSRGPLLAAVGVLGVLPFLILFYPWAAQLGWFRLERLGLTAAVLALLVGLLAEPRLGLMVFVFASGLAPAPEGVREGARPGDYVFLLLGLVLLARAALTRRRVDLRSPITLPVLVGTICSLIGLYWGIAVLGFEPRLIQSTGIIVKRLEYLAIFLLVINLIRTRRWAARLLLVMLVTAAIAVLQGLAATGGGAHLSVDDRLQGPDGNYNTMAGYLVPHLCLAVALAFVARRWMARIALALLAIGLLAGLFLTYSREGYVMLVGAMLFLGGLRYRFLLALLVALVLAAPWLVPEAVIERAENTVELIQNYETQSVGENSLRARIGAWQKAWRTCITRSPVLGVGPGNVNLSVDNEYLMRWSESGLIGLGVFVWLLWSMGRMLWSGFRRTADPTAQAVLLGCLGGFVALLIQGTVAPAFTTIRIMEAFSVLLGVAWIYARTPAEDTS